MEVPYYPLSVKKHSFEGSIQSLVQSRHPKVKQHMSHAKHMGYTRLDLWTTEKMPFLNRKALILVIETKIAPENLIENGDKTFSKNKSWFIGDRRSDGYTDKNSSTHETFTKTMGFHHGPTQIGTIGAMRVTETLISSVPTPEVLFSLTPGDGTLTHLQSKTQET